MKRNRKKHQKSALQITEEAFHLLRSSPVALLFSYYLGGVPFVLGLMYFWADMSRSAIAHQYSAMAALGIALLFAWMKYWQTVFTDRVRCRISGETPRRWSLNRVAAVAATQTLIQSTRFIILPVAALLVIPFGFCYAFYQNATAGVEAEIPGLKSTCRWAWKQAQLGARQNHVLIVIIWFFGMVIFLNVSVTAYLIPYLFKSLFGVESVFTMSGIRVILNTTFWVAMLAVTYLLLDPFIKTAYVLRCYYGSAIESGEDLITELNRLAAQAKKLAAGLLIVVMWAAPFASLAAQESSVSPQHLDRSIEEVMGRREFSWRMPRETARKDNPEVKGPIAAAVERVTDLIARGVKTVKKWVTRFFEWLEKLMPEVNTESAVATGNWMTPVRLGLFLLLLLLLVIVVVFLRIWRRRRTGSPEPISAVAAPVPDVADEGVKADDFPTNQWLTLAKELADKGELRLAMRALYLASLARLAEQEMITIEIYKSNREYEQELTRRAHHRAELVSIFSKCLNVFEQAWYGMYRPTSSDFDHFAANQKRILALAKT